jgi:hypothetical protein
VVSFLSFAGGGGARGRRWHLFGPRCLAHCGPATSGRDRCCLGHLRGGPSTWRRSKCWLSPERCRSQTARANGPAGAMTFSRLSRSGDVALAGTRPQPLCSAHHR